MDTSRAKKGRSKTASVKGLNYRHKAPSKRKAYDWSDTEDYIPGSTDSAASESGSCESTGDNDSSSEYYHPKRKKRRVHSKSATTATATDSTDSDIYKYPQLPSPPPPLTSQVYTVLPLAMFDDHRPSYVPTPDDTPDALGVRMPSWQDTFEEKKKNTIKKRHHGYRCNTTREPTSGIPLRFRRHINPKSFEYYTGMPQCWYSANAAVNGINTGRIINAHMAQLNYAHNLANEWLTDTIITNNIIEYPLTYINNMNMKQNAYDGTEWIDCEVEQNDEYWKALIAHLETDNQVLQQIHDKVMSGMVSRHRAAASESLPNRHKPFFCEEFYDLVYNHEAYAQHKHKLHEKSYIESQLNKDTLDRCLIEIERLKKGPNPEHRAKERKNELYRYYQGNKKKKNELSIPIMIESELQTESENDDVEWEKKRYDLNSDYNTKYERCHDIDALFDINKLEQGLPNGPLLIKLHRV